MMGNNLPRKILWLVRSVTDNQAKPSTTTIFGKLYRKSHVEFLLHYFLNVFLYQIYLIWRIYDDKSIGEAFAIVKSHLGNQEVAGFSWFYSSATHVLKLAYLLFNKFEAYNVESIGILLVFLLCKTLHGLMTPLVEEFRKHYKHQIIQNKVLTNMRTLLKTLKFCNRIFSWIILSVIFAYAAGLSFLIVWGIEAANSEESIPLISVALVLITFVYFGWMLWLSSDLVVKVCPIYILKAFVSPPTALVENYNHMTIFSQLQSTTSTFISFYQSGHDVRSLQILTILYDLRSPTMGVGVRDIFTITFALSVSVCALKSYFLVLTRYNFKCKIQR